MRRCIFAGVVGRGGALHFRACDVKAADRSFTIEVPTSWRSRPELAKKPTVLAAQGTTETLDQLVVTSYVTARGAEDEAVFVVTGLSASGTACARLEGSTVFGGQRLVFDCPSETEGTKYRRLFFPVEHKGRSILLLQTPGRHWTPRLASSSRCSRA